ncbi:MAG: hypothetical protein ACPGJS_00930 [Flammeovirgaceae bacterium]
MKYINYIILLMLIGVSVGCKKVKKDELVGIWLISDFTVNGFDRTANINSPHQQWVELKSDGTFRSGSYKIENHGVWHRHGQSNIITLEGENKDWCNSVWQVDALSQNLVFKGRKEIGNYLVNVILQRAEKLPIYKRYISKPRDQLIGFWKVDRLIHDGMEVANEGSWFRLRHGGEFAYGDQSGELLAGNFLYHHPDSTLTFKKTGNELVNQWKVAFDGKANIVLTHSINSAKMHLRLVPEFE